MKVSAEKLGWSLTLGREGLSGLLQDKKPAQSGSRKGWSNSPPSPMAVPLMRTIKAEEVELSDYQDYADAMRQIGRFLDEVYMRKRIHSSLGYLTPAEFESQWRQEQSSQPDMN